MVTMGGRKDNLSDGANLALITSFKIPYKIMVNGWPLKLVSDDVLSRIIDSVT